MSHVDNQSQIEVADMTRSTAAPGRAVALNHERTVTALGQCPLLTGLAREEIEGILARSTVQHFPAQRRVFEEGGRSRGAWVVTAGRVRLHHLMADGRQHVGGFRSPGSVLELTSALDGRPYMSTATALESSEMVLVPRALVSELARNYPITVRNAIEQLCLEVRQRDITTAIASLKDARGRIGCTLLWLATQFGVDDGKTTRIDYRLTRQDIADRSGVTIETAIRVMSDLQRRGIIRTHSQIIEILDIEKMRDPARCEECQFDCSVFASGTPQLIR
ncbi:MAG: hypothetical protein C0506_06445 [Anaerolinea sp.]|nr:hypothetical protein [Anaerolinea sp.]